MTASRFTSRSRNRSLLARQGDARLALCLVGAGARRLLIDALGRFKNSLYRPPWACA
jgi:hypothetical protein